MCSSDLAIGLLREEVRPDAADGTAGEEAAESTCDKRPRRFRHRFQHLRPVEIQFHFCWFLSFGLVVCFCRKGIMQNELSFK